LAVVKKIEKIKINKKDRKVCDIMDLSWTIQI